MAMIIGLGSHKGGVGKTTFSRAIALVGAAQDLSVHIADLDQEQQTAFEWSQRRIASGRKPDISVDVYANPEQALRRADEFDLIVLDGPARAKAMALEIAEASDLFIQPTKGVIDDMAPAVRMFHELVKHGIPKKKMVFALHGVSGGEGNRGWRRVSDRRRIRGDQRRDVHAARIWRCAEFRAHGTGDEVGHAECRRRARCRAGGSPVAHVG